MKQTIHCYVSGRVQGVCFRMATREQATLFGITGWVRNLPDGRVEVMACGEEEQVKQLLEWLHKGPEHAQVINLETKKIEPQEFENFSIR